MNMASETFLLKWRNHKQNVSSTLETSIEGNNFNDIVLVSDDLIPFNAHRFVLSANSPVMKEILLEHFHPKPLIYLRGVNSCELQALLQLIYFGEATFFTDRMEKLINTLEEFKLT